MWRICRRKSCLSNEKTPGRMGIASSFKLYSPMSHLCNLAKVSSCRGTRSIWLAGTSRPWLLARTPRTMFTTSRRSSVEPSQRFQEKINGSEPPRFDQLPYKNRGQPIAFYTMATIALCLMAYSV